MITDTAGTCLGITRCVFSDGPSSLAVAVRTFNIAAPVTFATLFDAGPMTRSACVTVSLLYQFELLPVQRLIGSVWNKGIAYRDFTLGKMRSFVLFKISCYLNFKLIRIHKRDKALLAPAEGTLLTNTLRLAKARSVYLPKIRLFKHNDTLCLTSGALGNELENRPLKPDFRSALLRRAYNIIGSRVPRLEKRQERNCEQQKRHLLTLHSLSLR